MAFQKARDMYRLQKEAKRVKRELKNIHIEAEHRGVTVVVSAEQKVISIDVAHDVPREEIAPHALDALNRALGKSQIVASERMQGVMGEMGIGRSLYPPQ